MKKTTNLKRKGMALMMALVMLAGLLPFQAMGAETSFTVSSQSDLDGLKEALGQMGASDILRVTFEADLVLDEPLHVAAGEVTFEAAPGNNIRLTLESGGDFRHILVTSNGNQSAFYLTGITLDGGGTGGGIRNDGGYPILKDVRIENCLTTGNGGGIEIANGLLELYSSVLENNTALGNGGALALMDPQSYSSPIEDSTFIGNSAVNGGAIYSLLSLQMNRSTVKDNIATGNFGGGIYAEGLTFATGEISGNIVEGDPLNDTQRPQGAGIYALQSVELTNIQSDSDLSQGDPTLVISENNFKNIAGLGAGVYTAHLTIHQHYYPGGYTPDYKNITFSDNGKQGGAYAGAYAGGAVYTATPDDGSASSDELHISHVQFTGNYADQLGGAVTSINKLLAVDSSYFYQNTTGAGSGESSRPFSAGGALYSSDSSSAMQMIPTFKSTPGPGNRSHRIENTSFIENSSDRGGAVLLDHTEESSIPQVDQRNHNNSQDTDTVLSGVTFTRNSATQDGGAIYLTNSSTSGLYIGCESLDGYSEESINTFDSNTAAGDGGAIWADPGRKTENLPRVYAGSATTFSGNSASELQEIDDTDRSLHAQRIFATDFTYGDYAYSNHDISYWSGEEPVRPTVTYYHGNGGEGGPYVDSSAAHGEDTVTVLTPAQTSITPVYNDNTNEWYGFLGWEDASGNPIMPGAQLKLQYENIVLTARWERLYRVEYYWDEDGDGSYDLIHTDPGRYQGTEQFTLWDAAGATPPASKVFSHWEDDAYSLRFAAGGKVAPGSIYSYDDSYTIRLHAQYDTVAPETWLLIYHSNEPSGNDTEVQAGSFLANTSIFTETYANLYGSFPHGYDFGGWNTQPDGSGTTYYEGWDVMTSAADLHLYAQWTPAGSGSYYVYYDENGGEAPYGALVDTNNYYGYQPNDSATVLSNEFEQNNYTLSWYHRNGHTFTGWNDQADGQGTDYAPGDSLAMPGAHVILYAKWEENLAPTYSITYKANGGSGDDVVKDGYSEGDAVILENNPFTRDGYRFDGWNTAADGSGDSYTAGGSLLMPSKNMILYAQWKQNTTPPVNEYSVTYYANGGEGTLVDAKSPYRGGVQVTVLSPAGKISREEYGFVEWNTRSDGGGTPYSPGQAFIIDQDIDLYAQWRKIPDPQPPEGEVELELEDHYAYLMGYPDGTVRPAAGITREEAAAIFFRLLTEESREKYLKRENSFSDVSTDRWSNSSISTLTNAGILKGYPDGSFGPQKHITRAEFAAIVSRFDTREIENPVAFSDTDGHWAEEEIGRAAALGWIRGNPDGTFAPEKNITRAEVTALVNRMLLRLVEDESALLSDMKTWPDNADTSIWYYLDIQEASNSHLYERIGETQYEKWTQIIDGIEWSELEKPAAKETKSAADTVSVQPMAMQTTVRTSQTVPAPVSTSTEPSSRSVKTEHATRADAYVKRKTTVTPTINFIPTLQNSDNPDQPVYSGSITGTGIPGATITLYLPGGASRTGTVETTGKWSIAVDYKYLLANHSGFVGAIQRIDGEKESAMATRTLYCQAEGTLSQPNIGDNRLQGTATPNAVISAQHYSYSSGYETFSYNTAADNTGNWSIDLSPALANYDTVNLYFIAPGCVSNQTYFYIN